MGFLDKIAIFVSAIVSILIFFYGRQHDDNIRFLNVFNKIYKETFELRKRANKVTISSWNVPFYYEYDSITSFMELEESILDYMTELENFFSFIGKHQLSKSYRSFCILISWAFFQRVAALYSYILKKRICTGNKVMFKNYIVTVRKMKKMKKIKQQCLDKQRKCYIGIRESDVYYAKGYFKKTICLFNTVSSNPPFSVRFNQNINHREMLPFYSNALQSIDAKKKSTGFYFYNQRTAYNYNITILQKSKCINSKELLDFINNKLSVKEWFVKNELPVIPFETFMGKELLFSKLCTHFKGYCSFVIQSAHGGGGIGTFYADQKCFSEISDKVESLQRYIVSPYVPNISVNTHIFVAEKQTVLSPASVQIIEHRKHQLCYRGGDFVAFQKMSESVKKEIKILSLKIADLLRAKGYRGIAGIDFIVDNKEKVYCCEINPRFQASTFILDRHMQENNSDPLTAKSCFELNEMAFQGCMITTLCFEDKINYSCYMYYKDGMPLQYIKDKFVLLKKNKNIDVFADGMEYYLDNSKINEDSYLFRAVFPHAISKVSSDMTLWINDNIPIFLRPSSDIAFKTALLNQGVRLESNIPNIKAGVYESIDICIKKSDCIQENLKINCAYGIYLSKYSPYLIKKTKTAEELYYYGEKIAEIAIERNSFANLPDLDKKILFLATDRLRIKIVSGCENKNAGKGCSFCNVPVSKHRFSLAEIEQALEDIKRKDLYFRHILIGGGSCLSEDSWDKIIDVCKYLKSDNFYKSKPISIMTMLPPKNKLLALKDAGVEEVAFNLEIADDELGHKLMPAKRTQSKDAYYEILRDSVRIFGTGNVRSALLVGLDKEESIYNEITTLAEIGVFPCLSAFRALPQTDYENDLGPDNAYLLKVYHHASELLQQMSGPIRQLGPNCTECRNNMLIL